MILVTGATGLLGTHILAELLQTEMKIRALYRDASKISLAEKIINYYYPNNYTQKIKQIEWFKCDIEDIPTLEKAFENIHKVVHCAATVSFRRRDFSKMIQVNRKGTENMVNCALNSNVEHFCHVSSTAAVGKKDKKTTDVVQESNKWDFNDLVSGYGISKYLAEKEVWRGIEEGLKAVIVNPCVLIGPGNWNESSLSIFRTVKKGLHFYAPGANAVVDARDVATIILLLQEKKCINQRFLLIGENLYFRELINKIAFQLGKKPPHFHTPRFLAEIAWRFNSLKSLFTRKSATLTKETVRSAYSRTVYSNDKIKSELNFVFRTADEAIKNTVSFNNQLK
jgi:nucleoside-diphosphate-sugar epimerase